jgi:hypothetical protein
MAAGMLLPLISDEDAAIAIGIIWKNSLPTRPAGL